MFEEFFPLIYVGIAGAVIAVGLKAYLALQGEKLKIAAREKIDLSKPEASIDQFFGMLQNAPQYLQIARAEMEKIKEQNKGKNIDLSAQEYEIKMLETLSKYQRPLMIIAPILNPIAKKYIKGFTRGL